FAVRVQLDLLGGVGEDVHRVIHAGLERGGLIGLVEDVYATVDRGLERGDVDFVVVALQAVGMGVVDGGGPAPAAAAEGAAQAGVHLHVLGVIRVQAGANAGQAGIETIAAIRIGRIGGIGAERDAERVDRIVLGHIPTVVGQAGCRRRRRVLAGRLGVVEEALEEERQIVRQLVAAEHEGIGALLLGLDIVERVVVVGIRTTEVAAVVAHT